MPLDETKSVENNCPKQFWMQQHKTFHRLFQVYMKSFKDNFQPK